MRRKRPRRHTVHTKHPRYNILEYLRGKGLCGGTPVIDGSGGGVGNIVNPNSDKSVEYFETLIKELDKKIEDANYGGDSYRYWSLRKERMDLEHKVKLMKNRGMVKPKHIKTVKGVSYFPSHVIAKTYALKNSLPIDRIIEYDRGWAIQRGKSGSYYNVKEKTWQ